MTEHYVTSLELSKALKEAGVPQKSEFYWWEDSFGTVKGSRLKNHIPQNPQGGWNYYSAFLSDELGVILRPICGKKARKI